MRELPEPRTAFVHLSGDFTSKGETVHPGTPAVLPGLPRRQNLNRLDLAGWLVSPDHPLTARVTVNRMWQRYFGLGLVETEADFGSQGTPPSHPRLLDWLASEFIRRDWSMKAMHRLIVTSATYRQSSAARPELLEVDPGNRLLAPAEPAAPGGRDYPGYSAGHLRSACLHRWGAERISASAGRVGAVHSGQPQVGVRRGTQPLSPRHVYVFPALRGLPRLNDVRCTQRSIHRDQAKPLEYAASGIDSA